ncbi:hypothetical protein [Desulfosporosinus sp. Sb-LF]|uniref:phage tail fiber protein n=1 Tax=Desulfosporosinus sp. Sb-LF TaxID=2560027 RepID=UPI00107FA8AF|nr:hypothetical protein [Desulfosporosinus sp. Sb-LF]TGE31335.1 hypothetical protein E4K68_17935 [Desulfosporosinus sp. Sb-LF]
MLLAPAAGAFTIDDTTSLATAATYEVASNTGYTRKAISWAAPTVVSGAGTISNSAQVDFGNWLVDQGTNKISQIAIVDAASGTTGKVLAWFVIASGSELQPVTGQPVRIPAAGLTISLD